MLLQESMDHMTKARALMDKGDLDSLRCAALQIRMGIERLFYRLLPHYQEELTDDLLRRWQPKQIIDALLECNPDVERDFTFRMGEERTDGTPGPAVIEGQQKAVTRKLLKDHYHRLGSYLHASVRGEPVDLEKLRADLDEAANRVEQICRETTAIANFGTFHKLTCECGRTIKRNARAVELKGYARCPDEKCGAEYDFLGVEDCTDKWSLRTVDFNCEKCGKDMTLGSHLLKEGWKFDCKNCPTSYVIKIGPNANPVAPPNS